MAEYSVKARPYAKAAFEVALSKSQLSEWEVFLDAAAQVAGNTEVQTLLHHPSVTQAQKAQLFLEVCEKFMSESHQNFLLILAANHRLTLLVEIAKLYRVYYAEHQRTLEVDIISAMPLSDVQQTTLTQALTRKMNKTVNTAFSTDKSLLGGVLVRSGDIVIDGSVRGKLNRLKSTLLTNMVGEQMQ